MLNIGVKPTLGESLETSIEVHFFNFSGDLYGKEIELTFVDRIREEQKFENIENLKLQLKEDQLTANQLLNLPGQ